MNQDDVERIAAKYERLRNNFLKLLEKPVRYIVLSNTQNNIEEFYPYKTQGMNISLDANIVSEIACAPRAINQYGRAEIIVLSYPRSCRPIFAMRKFPQTPKVEVTALSSKVVLNSTMILSQGVNVRCWFTRRLVAWM
ncbi:hypothetical protein [Rhizobium lusitanum]|uniref:hypothetical protein n=1 Tax=Rhizobium lusitanum TaxID=293958 RepID=UPI000B8A443A|nr:hypothetical protein [Rhizobium lusitanum]